MWCPEEEEPLIAAIADIAGSCLIRDVFRYPVESKRPTGQRLLAEAVEAGVPFDSLRERGCPSLRRDGLSDANGL